MQIVANPSSLGLRSHLYMVWYRAAQKSPVGWAELISKKRANANGAASRYEATRDTKPTFGP